MPPRLRKFALAAHLTLSVGWIGAVAAYIALDVAAATGQDAQTVRAAYLGMELIARSVIVPLALASLLTGLVMSLGHQVGLAAALLGPDLAAADHRRHGRLAVRSADHQLPRRQSSSSEDLR